MPLDSQALHFSHWLSGRTGASHGVDLRVDDDTYAAIRRLADQDHRDVSDVVREAIRRYLEAS
jgi:hypothetical protein